MQLKETIALLDFITSFKDIPTRMSRNRPTEEFEEFRKLKVIEKRFTKR